MKSMKINSSLKMPKESLGGGKLSRKSPFSVVNQISKEFSPWVYANHKPFTKAPKKKTFKSGL